MSTSKIEINTNKHKSPFVGTSSDESNDHSHMRKKKLKTVGYIKKDLNDEIIQNLCEEIKEDHKFSIQLLEQYVLVQKRIKNKMK